jgi:TolB-like protein
MEYIEGLTLEQLIRRNGARPIAEVLSITEQVGRALAYAHSRVPSVVHRDIKPSNILIEQETGRAMVADFGIAKLIGRQETTLTHGGVIGTIGYCAPEQLRGEEDIDGRADIFSLGLVVYEMLTGKRLFTGPTRRVLIARLYDREPPLEFDGETPPELTHLVRRAIARNRRDRHPDVSSLLAEVAQLKSRIGSRAERGELASTRREDDWFQLEAGTGDLEPDAPFRQLSARHRRWLVAIVIAMVLSAGALVVALQVRGRFSTVPNGAQTPKGIAVMDFTAWQAGPGTNWMGDAIRGALNAQLSKAAGWQVLAKEIIDFQATKLLQTGTYTDLAIARMHVVEARGVPKAVFGTYRVDAGRVRITAHVVDMMTSIQEQPDMVEGDAELFSELPLLLAVKIMHRIGIEVPGELEGSLATAPGKSSLESYRLLMEAERPPAAPVRDRQAEPSNERTGGLLWRHMAWFVPYAAFAQTEGTKQGGSDEPRSDEDTIRITLERYREANEKKDLSLLAETYDQITPEQLEASTRYFENARDLAVAIEDVDIAVSGSEAAVSYTRTDRFTDAATGEDVVLEIRTTKILVQTDGVWKIAAR